MSYYVIGQMLPRLEPRYTVGIQLVLGQAYDRHVTTDLFVATSVNKATGADGMMRETRRVAPTIRPREPQTAPPKYSPLLAGVLISMGLMIAGCSPDILPSNHPSPYPDVTTEPPEVFAHPAPDLPEERSVPGPGYGDVTSPSPVDASTTDDLSTRKPQTPDITVVDIDSLVALDATPEVIPDDTPPVVTPDSETFSDAAPVDIPPDAGEGTDDSDVTVVADTLAIDTPEITTCTPDPCTGFLELATKGPMGEGLCIQFETSSNAGLEASPPHVSIQAVDWNHDSWPDVSLLNEKSQVTLWGFKSGLFQPGQTLSLPETNKTPVMAWGDLDNDGWIDLFLSNGTKGALFHNVNGTLQVFPSLFDSLDFSQPITAAAFLGAHLLLGTEAGILVYKNLGGGGFADVSSGIGIGDADIIAGFAIDDFDQDGLPDVYAYKSIGKNRLLRQLPGLTFESLEDKLAVAGTGNSTYALWTRYNSSLFPSLFVPNYYGANNFYANQDGTTFTDMALPLGLSDPKKDLTQVVFVSPIDFTGTGKPAFFLARWELPNLLLRPQLAADGTVVSYENYSYALGMAQTAQTRGAISIDYDQDQQVDLIVLTYQGLTLFHNQSHWVKTCLQ